MRNSEFSSVLQDNMNSNVSNGNHKKKFNNKRPNIITFNGSFDSKKIKHSPNLENEKSNNANSNTLDFQRKALPIYNGRQKLINEIYKMDTLIIVGETGCGKTTQIPQYIYESKINNSGIIGITQPRRIAATTLSKRVSMETHTNIGDLVGYCIRFEDVTSEKTKIKFLTDGMLLRESILDDKLLKYNVVILDEAHERTIHTDVLFGIVKKAQCMRKRERLPLLKIIVMSATMDVDHFSRYFDSAPVVYLEGRQHNVQIMHSLEHQDDYLFACIVTVFQIHQETNVNGDILVFVTGQEEAEAMTQKIRQVAKTLRGDQPPMHVFSLYSALQASKLQGVFRPAPPNTRKVIVSTNVAETSVTIPGIKYVVDSGKVKAKMYHPRTGLDSLKVKTISQAQAWQRTGRAGRECDGICYRMFTKDEYQKMELHTQPEILRSSLSTVCLQLLAMKVNILQFDFIDQPSKESISAALRELKMLGAAESLEKPSLTRLGHKMARFPIDPRYSKILLSAQNFGCSEEILSIIAVLSVDAIFLCPLSKRQEAKEAHQKFVSSAGDHITLLQVYRNFRKTSDVATWCRENYLHLRNLQYAVDVRKQLSETCKSMSIVLESCGQDYEKIRRCLVTGLFMNVAELQRDKEYFTIGSRQKVALHPSSVLAGTLPPYILFSELMETSKSYVRNLSLVDPEWLTELAPDYFRKHRLSGLGTTSNKECMARVIGLADTQRECMDRVKWKALGKLN